MAQVLKSSISLAFIFGVVTFPLGLNSAVPLSDQPDVHTTKFNSFSYSFITTKKLAWIDAFKSCKTLGATLASVDSMEELEYIRDVLNSIGKGHGEYAISDSYYVSGSDIYREGSWVWMSNGNQVPNNFWAPNQPDNYVGVQHCTCHYPFNNWLLQDIQCTTPLNYICKRSINEC